MRSLLKRSMGVFLSIFISLILVVGLSFLLSKQPLKTIRYFFLGPFGNLYSLGNMLNNAIPLIFGGLGVSIAFRSNNFNLGGEGQIYCGAFVTTICAIALSSLGWLGGILALIAGAVAAGFLGGLSGFFRMKWNTSELITSFLISNAVVLIINYLITGPFFDPTTNLITTRKVPSFLFLSNILLPSDLSSGIFVALLFVLIVHFYLFNTKSGYELRLCGNSSMFARYSGLNVKWYTAMPMFLSGALYGLGGGLAIYGTYHSCIKEFSSGMGWNGLAVALIAQYNPYAVVPAAIFFAWIGSGARIAMQRSDVTLEIASIAQAFVFFLITSEVLQGKRRSSK